MSEKVNGQKGNSPDQKLRSLSKLSVKEGDWG